MDRPIPGSEDWNALYEIYLRWLRAPHETEETVFLGGGWNLAFMLGPDRFKNVVREILNERE